MFKSKKSNPSTTQGNFPIWLDVLVCIPGNLDYNFGENFEGGGRGGAGGGSTNI